MSKRRWGWSGLAGLVVLVIGLAGAALARFDPNSLKPMLVAAAGNATGRTLRLGGDITIAWSLRPGIEITDVSLSNMPGGSRGDMVHADRVIVVLSLPALLQRRIEVSTLTLVGPDILFEQVNKKPNWRFDLPDQPASGAPAQAAAPYSLDLRDTHVQDGMVTWRLPARTKVLGIRAMDVRHETPGGPIEFNGTFVYGDNQPFRLGGSTRPTGGLADPWTTRLDLAAFDTTASATGTVSTAGIYDLQLEAASGALERLNALLPEMQLPPLHQVTLTAHLANGLQPGDLPVIGAARLRFANGEAGARLPGLKLGAFDIRVDKPGGTATLAGSGQYNAQAFTLAGTTGVPLHPDGPAELPLDLELKATPHGAQASGRLGLKGKLSLHALAFAGLDGTVSLTTPALAALRPLVSASLPTLTDLRLDSRFTLPARLDSVAFAGMKMASRQGDIAGDGTLGVQQPLVMSGRLHAERLDLEAMLAAFGIDLAPPKPGQVPGGPLISDAPLDWDMLRGPTLDVSARADTLLFMDQTWHDVDLTVLLKDGHLQRGALSVVSGGSPVSVTLAADARRPAVPVSLGIDAEALPLPLVARYAGLPGPVSGTARVQARLQGTGRSLHELAASLTGTASLATVGGQLRNDAFVQLTQASLDALHIKVPAQGETALRCLGVAAAFQAGVGTLSPIALETTYLSLSGQGRIDLGRETLALQLKPLAQVSGSAIEVPVVVEGPFRKLAGRLDATVFDKLGLAVDALFGNDRSTACVDAGLIERPAR